MKPQGRYITLKVNPINDRIGSLFLPESYLKKEIKTREGVVDELGTAKNFDFEVKVGDRVLYNREGEEELGDNITLIKKDKIFYVYPKD